MARTKKTAQTSDAIQAYVDAQFAARDLSKGTTDSAIAMATAVGLKLPFLSQRILFQRTNLPFGRTCVIYGPSGSNKSSLLYEFYELFRVHEGKYFHLDVEDKDTPVLRLSLTNYDANAGEVRPCLTLDEYQTEVEGYINWYAGMCAAKGSPGKVIPVAIGIDSLVAKMTAEAADRVRNADGATERRFADEARALSDWFKYIPGRLTRLPMMLFGVNHDKPKKNERTGQMIHSSPGGAAPNYFSTFKIFAERVAKLKQDSEGWEGNKIKLEMHKNSLGGDGQQVEVEIKWTTFAATSRSGGERKTVKQVTKWRWAKATIEHLYRLQGIEGKRAGKRGRIVEDVLGIRKITGGRYHSKALGVTAQDAMEPSKLGMILEDNQEILSIIEPELGIHQAPAFIPLTDYDSQLASAAKLVDDVMPADEPMVEPSDESATESE